MKTLRLATLALALSLVGPLLSGPAHAQLSIPPTDFQTVVDRAEAADTPILVEVYTSWCPYCERMQEEVYADETVKEYLESNFTYVRLNSDTTGNTTHRFDGRSVTLEMHPGISARAMQFEGAPDGLKMACGENPKGVYGARGQMPSTRMGTAAVFRRELQAAVEKRREYENYREKLADWKSKPDDDREDRPTPPSRDFGTETLIDALDGDILVHFHCYRADDMVRMLEIADQYGLEIRSFHHATQSYKIRDLLAKWDVAVSIWTDWWGFKMEAHDAIPHNAGLMEKAGGRPIIHSDSHTGIQRLNQNAARSMWEARHAGMDVTRQDALRWITANAAWALGILDETGTLEEGKRADVVLWSGDPFSVYSTAEKVWVEGVREYDRSRDQQPWSDFEVGTEAGSGWMNEDESNNVDADGGN